MIFKTKREAPVVFDYLINAVGKIKSPVIGGDPRFILTDKPAIQINNAWRQSQSAYLFLFQELFNPFSQKKACSGKQGRFTCCFQ